MNFTELQTHFRNALPPSLEWYLDKEAPNGLKFLSAEQMLECKSDMIWTPAQFLPFATDEVGDYFGLWIDGENAKVSQILYLDTETGQCKPLASTLEKFIYQICLMSESEQIDEEKKLRNQFLEQIHQPPLRVARNDTELHQMITAHDDAACFSLCALGCGALMVRDNAKAMGLFERASKAFPMGGDPYFLIADIHRDQEHIQDAIPFWWKTLNCMLTLCTSSTAWNLGDDYPEADIAEIAADCLLEHALLIPQSLKDEPLWKVVETEEIYSASAREQLGDLYLKSGNYAAAESHFNSALALDDGKSNHSLLRIGEKLVGLYDINGQSILNHLVTLDIARWIAQS